MNETLSVSHTTAQVRAELRWYCAFNTMCTGKVWVFEEVARLDNKHTGVLCVCLSVKVTEIVFSFGI